MWGGGVESGDVCVRDIPLEYPAIVFMEVMMMSG